MRPRETVPQTVSTSRRTAPASSFENDLAGAMVCQSSFRRKMLLVLPYCAMFFNIHLCFVDYIVSDRVESIENLIGMPWARRIRIRTPHAQLCNAWKRDPPKHASYLYQAATWSARWAITACQESISASRSASTPICASSMLVGPCLSRASIFLRHCL